MNIKQFINYDNNERQKDAYQYVGSGKIIFYGGARGGGKSFFALSSAMAVAVQFPGIRIVIIRQTYNELDDVFIQNLGDFPETVFGYKYRDKNKQCKFRNGSIILFRSCETKQDVKKIQGAEYQYLIVDEANNYDYHVLTSFFGSVRHGKGQEMTFIPTVLLTGNPGGVSDLWFKTRFVNPDYKYWDEGEFAYKDDYIFISAKAKDNPYLNDKYHSMLNQLPENLRRAWRDGEWNVFEGQFFEEWNNNVHIVEPFDIPTHWHKSCGFDLGFTKDHPSVCLWGAQDPDTLDVYIYREYEAYDSSSEVYAIELADWFEQDDYDVSAIYADPSMFSTSVKHKESDDNPASYFIRENLPFMRADNDRVNGWRTLKQWLHWGERKSPKLKFFDSCVKIVQLMPNYRYSPKKNSEDLDTNQMLDDYADALRYLMKTGFIYPTAGEVENSKLIAQDNKTLEKYRNKSIHEMHERFMETDRNFEPLKLNFARRKRSSKLTNSRARY